MLFPLHFNGANRRVMALWGHQLTGWKTLARKRTGTKNHPIFLQPRRTARKHQLYDRCLSPSSSVQLPWATATDDSGTRMSTYCCCRRCVKYTPAKCPGAIARLLLPPNWRGSRQIRTPEPELRVFESVCQVSVDSWVELQIAPLSSHVCFSGFLPLVNRSTLTNIQCCIAHVRGPFRFIVRTSDPTYELAG